MFYVFSSPYNVRITTDDNEEAHDENFCGEFKVFTDAKKLATQIMATKVSNFRADYEEARLNKALLSSITKKRVLND